MPQVRTEPSAPNVIEEIQCGLWMSLDNGESWSGPMGVLPDT